MRFADIDAVTLDSYGTLVTVDNPAPPLDRSLRAHGVARERAAIEAAFHLESRYYAEHCSRGHDDAAIAELHRDCTQVFLDALDARIPADSFVAEYIGVMQLEPLPGVRETLVHLGSLGLELVVVSNADADLCDRLERAGIGSLVSGVVTSAEAGAAKPDPAIFRVALEQIGVKAERAIHVGDADIDEQGAAAVGMRFVPAPLATAFEGWT
jgi:HAD superfamily hydrolase (TIGR01509 family)